MAGFPNLLMIRPTEGLAPVPTQERILDFTPISQALATAPRAGSTGESKGGKDMGDLDWSEMRLGYAQQMYNTQKMHQDKMASLVRAWGEAAYSMPEYQQAEKDWEESVHPHYFMVGKQELKKENNYIDYVQEKGIGNDFNIPEWLGGHGLKTHSQWEGHISQVSSHNYDPTEPFAGWREDFNTAPSNYNIKDAREEADKLFEPAMNKMTSQQYGDVIAEIVGGAYGTSHVTSESSSNENALSYATQQALNYAGFRMRDTGKKDKKGNPIMEPEGVNFDVTSPLVSGYLQGFLQEQFKGDKQGELVDNDGVLMADDNGLTAEGRKKFAKYVSNDIATYHQNKRIDTHVGSDKTWTEYSPEGYGGAGIKFELENNIDAATRFQEGEHLTQDGGMTFDNMFLTGMSPEQKKYWSDPNNHLMNADGTFTGKGIEEREKWRTNFNKMIQPLDQDGTPLTPPMYIVERAGGQEYYKPNPEFFGKDVNVYMEKIIRNRNNELKDMQAEIERGDLTQDELQKYMVRMNEIKNDFDIVKTLSDKGRRQQINSTPYTPFIKGVKSNQYHIDGGYMTGIDEEIDKNLKNTEDFTNHTILFGTSWVGANSMPNSDILETYGGWSLVDAPGAQNWGTALATPTNLQMAKQKHSTGISVGGDGNPNNPSNPILLNGVPYETFIDPRGNIEVIGYQSTVDNGYLLPVMDNDQRMRRLNSQYQQAQSGNPQAGETAPTVAVKMVDYGTRNLKADMQGNFQRENTYNYADEDAKKVIANLKRESDILVPNSNGEIKVVVDRQPFSSSPKIGPSASNVSRRGYDINTAILNKYGISEADVKKKLDKLGSYSTSTVERTVAELIMEKQGTYKFKPVKTYEQVPKLNPDGTVNEQYARQINLRPATAAQQAQGYTHVFTGQHAVTSHVNAAINATKADGTEYYSKVLNQGYMNAGVPIPKMPTDPKTGKTLQLNLKN